ncbi:tRNA-binding protein [Halodesulfovibrio spirochaetisodalis]|uniref:tRNA-binding protein n=1 Tax=Halodesulfovibrio spirochaetisodalis TaxID=1560234 RepID=A0A1B7X8Z9_9BACT|nr:tRNA-binding protein [Halodesulfovibrio spirochaetisodalis]OBQ45802.1 tRNA-binding protein [Halodesulfovibrio spirochaetisodalis]
METITWNEFEKVELRVGKILSAEVFKEARKPAYIMQIDFGEEIGLRKSSAQITVHYTPEELVGRRIVAVVNFPKKQIGPIMSECLVTGFADDAGAIVLCGVDRDVPLGAKLC